MVARIHNYLLTLKLQYGFPVSLFAARLHNGKIHVTRLRLLAVSHNLTVGRIVTPSRSTEIP